MPEQPSIINISRLVRDTFGIEIGVATLAALEMCIAHTWTDEELAKYGKYALDGAHAIARASHD